MYKYIWVGCIVFSLPLFRSALHLICHWPVCQHPQLWVMSSIPGCKPPQCMIKVITLQSQQNHTVTTQEIANKKKATLDKSKAHRELVWHYVACIENQTPGRWQMEDTCWTKQKNKLVVPWKRRITNWYITCDSVMFWQYHTLVICAWTPYCLKK